MPPIYNPRRPRALTQVKFAKKNPAGIFNAGGIYTLQ
jgi:hypothetical protein